MAGKVKDINLLAVSHKTGERAENENSVRRDALIYGIPALLLALVVIMYTGFKLANNSMQDHIDEMNDYLNSESVVYMKQVNSSLALDIQEYGSFQSRLNNINMAIEAMPELSAKQIKALTDTMQDVSVKSVRYADHVLVMQCSADSYTKGSLYVQRIRQTGVYSEIEYTGFTGNTGTYEFTIKMTDK